MAAVATQIQVQARPITPPQHLTLNTTLSGKPTAIPNKHIPFCSPGPVPSHGLPSPPASPPSSIQIPVHSSILHPPTDHRKVHDDPQVYAISALTLGAALEQASRTPLPDPRLVFPWMHGLHADNQMQLSFFQAKKRSARRVPSCLRGITIVKVRGDLSHSKIKGSIAPEELLMPLDICKNRHSLHCRGGPCFVDVDPPAGFGVRNFQIQPCKMATVSDIIVYGDAATSKEEVEELACLMAKAQQTWAERNDMDVTDDEARFNTFILEDDFSILSREYPEIIAADSEGNMPGEVMDFPHQERLEMLSMSRPTEIAPNVWLGLTPDNDYGIEDQDELPHFDIWIEAADFVDAPPRETLDEVVRYLDEHSAQEMIAQLQFPSSGSFIAGTLSAHVKIDQVLTMCKWIHAVTSASGSKRNVLLHCADGYTETSAFALAYLMFAECLPAHEAYVKLHRDKQREYFSYSTDKNFLETHEKDLMLASPAKPRILPTVKVPKWTARMDGSLPSRILPYLYLGNITHANNPGLLEELGIRKVLSVGEPVHWFQDAARFGATPDQWKQSDFGFVDKVQDNGVDPLTDEFGRCLQFIGRSRRAY